MFVASALHVGEHGGDKKSKIKVVDLDSGICSSLNYYLSHKSLNSFTVPGPNP
jgi:hypothetical protein